MNHFDCWVPTEHFIEAAEYLVSQGWVPRQYTATRRQFRDEFGRDLYLHWQLLGPDIDAKMLANAVRLEMRETAFCALDPVDLLIHLCTAFDQWDARSSLLWVADACMIFARHPELTRNAVSDRVEQIGISPFDPTTLASIMTMVVPPGIQRHCRLA